MIIYRFSFLPVPAQNTLINRKRNMYSTKSKTQVYKI